MNVPISFFRKGEKFIYMPISNRHKNHHYQFGDEVTCWEYYATNNCIKTDDCRLVAIEDLQMIPLPHKVKRNSDRTLSILFIVVLVIIGVAFASIPFLLFVCAISIALHYSLKSQNKNNL